MNDRPVRVVGVGEILWDVFPDGPRFGGAPANFACHAAALGAHVDMVSAVGRDALGDEAVDILEQRGVGIETVQRHPDRATGTVDVTLDDRGVASYSFANDTAWDAIEWSETLAQLARRADVACFGTLGQRSRPSRETIQQFVSSMPVDTLRIFDINLRPPYVDDDVVRQSLDLANVLKLNEDELPYVAKLYNLGGTEPQLLEKLADRFSFRCVALSRGRHGAVLHREGETATHTGENVEVVDTVGAGDAFTAALALGLAAGDELRTINRRACRLAAYVCSQSGATPLLPAEWSSGVNGLDEPRRSGTDESKQ